MGEVRAELAKMDGNLTALRQSANLTHKIQSKNVNGHGSMQKNGTKNLD
jgi:hypothetical protein